MKKSLVVLTILVLVASFAFAKVTGSVEAKYKFDFTDEEATYLTYGVFGTNAKISFSLTTDEGGVNGSNKPYAVVAVGLKLTAGAFETKDPERLQWDEDDGYSYHAAAFEELEVSLVLSDFRIVGENWEINFLKAIGVGDYAKSAWEVDTGKKKAIDAPWDFAAEEGITVTYEGYKVGLAAFRFGSYHNVNLRSESKEFEIADGVKGQAAVAVGLTKLNADEDLSFDFGVSAKAAYEKDDLAVSGAFDLQYVAKQFDADVAVKVAVKPVTVDAYYATNVKSASQRYFFASKKNIASVRVALALDPVTVTVYGENLVNNDRILAVKEEGKFGALSEDAQFGIMPTLGNEVGLFGNDTAGLWFANAGVGYDVQENLNVNAHVGYERFYEKGDAYKFVLAGLAVQAGAEYKLEVATITADAYVGKVFAKIGDEDDSSNLEFACKIAAKSDKLVENAVLSATLVVDKEGVIGLYNSTRAVDEFSNDPEDAFGFSGKNMSFTVSCKVNF